MPGVVFVCALYDDACLTDVFATWIEVAPSPHALTLAFCAVLLHAECSEKLTF